MKTGDVGILFGLLSSWRLDHKDRRCVQGWLWSIAVNDWVQAGGLRMGGSWLEACRPLVWSVHQWCVGGMLAGCRQEVRWLHALGLSVVCWQAAGRMCAGCVRVWARYAGRLHEGGKEVVRWLLAPLVCSVQARFSEPETAGFRWP